MSSLDLPGAIAGIIVVAFGVCLIGLALLIAGRRAVAERFLRSFASSARAHYTEQGMRLVVGVSMVGFARLMWYPGLFRSFGWLIIASTVVLLVIPWRWHHRFATRVMPPVYRHLWLFALGALGLGAFVLYAASRALILN